MIFPKGFCLDFDPMKNMTAVTKNRKQGFLHKNFAYISQNLLTQPNVDKGKSVQHDEIYQW